MKSNMKNQKTMRPPAFLLNYLYMKKAYFLILSAIAALVGCGDSSSGASDSSEELVLTGRHGSCYVGADGPESYMRVVYDTPRYTGIMFWGEVFQKDGVSETLDFTLGDVKAGQDADFDAEEYFCATAKDYFLVENRRSRATCENGKMHIDLGFTEVKDYQGSSYEDVAVAAASAFRATCTIFLESFDERVYGEEMQAHYIDGCNVELLEDGKTIVAELSGDGFTATERTVFDGADSYSEDTYIGVGEDFMAQICEAYKSDSENYDVNCSGSTIKYWTRNETFSHEELEEMEAGFCQLMHFSSLEDLIFAN